MDLQSDCYAYNQNMMSVSSIDPLVNENLRQFHESVTEMEQQFSQGTSSHQDCFQFATEEGMPDWSLDSLPIFPDMQILPNSVSIDENNQQIPMVDELRQESVLTQFPTNYEQLQQASESTKLPMSDEQLQLQSKLTQMQQKPTKKRSIKNSTHEYNTRSTAYKKRIDEFIKAQTKITEEAKKKSCPPTILKVHAKGQWIYPKDRAQIVLLKCDIKPIKHPNYVQKRKYRSKKISI
ncbi:uncharacterized protein LOC114128397 [Aphis gossypii]|uniref:uncharacterized protein LOC114128397 n=1 Tax=Aphis gossypii TaxID=80765 RepID=UPI0021594429|nr:uncharacterized protein LOC114128397 [Aphis gossypii]